VPIHTSADECNFRITKPVMLQDYYPEDSRAQRHEGPVIVEFTLDKKADAPGNPKVVFSSLYDDLDRAALLAVRSMEMSADCGPQRHRLAIQWELKDE
jgi:TonB family protein